MRLSLESTIFSCALLPLALSSGVALASGDLVGTATPDEPAIYGGEPVHACGFPTTVDLNGCTGTLIHPRVIISAAHCFEGGGNAQVVFADNFSSPGKQVGTSMCMANPNFDGTYADNDIAFCVLNEEVNDVPIVPVLMGCGTNALTNGQEVAVVGFGQADDNLGDGPKRQVFTTITGIEGGELLVGGGGLDSCVGDSGGPVYLPMGDGSWRVVGVTSSGGECGTGGYYSMMHNNIGWVEQNSGYDVTPCHDADGTWNPGPECGNSPTEPHIGAGTWSNGCAGGASKAMEEICEGGSVDASGGDDGGDTGDPGEGDTGDSGDGGSDGASGTDAGSEVGSGSETSAGLDEGDGGDDRGCGCSSTGAGGYPGWMALGLLLPMLRRRRAR